MKKETWDELKKNNCKHCFGIKKIGSVIIKNKEGITQRLDYPCIKCLKKLQKTMKNSV